MKLFRLAKLLRVVRAARLFNKWETSFAVSYGQLQLVNMVVMLVLIAHWVACLWEASSVLVEGKGLGACWPLKGVIYVACSASAFFCLRFLWFRFMLEAGSV